MLITDFEIRRIMGEYFGLEQLFPWDIAEYKYLVNEIEKLLKESE